MHYSNPSAAIERKPNQLGKLSMALIAAALLCLSLFAASLTLLGVYQLAWSGPFRDIWEFIGEIQQQLQGNWSLAYLIDAYGGAHRIFLPKLIFWADYRFFGGSNLLTISLSLACQLFSLWLCARLWRTSSLAAWQRCLLIALMIAALFHAGQLFNFLYAMDVQWFMANTFALLALTTAARAKNYSTMWQAFFCAIAASLCNFTGLMAVVLIAIYGFFFTIQRKSIYTGLLFAAGNAVYLLWYVQTGKASENFILDNFVNSETIEQLLFHTASTLLNLVPFTLKMLSNPLSREWPVTGMTLACFSIIFLAQQTLQLRQRASATQQVAVMWCWYILLGCAFTALGRILYPNSATAERYLTLTLPYWALITSLLFLQYRSVNRSYLCTALITPLLVYFYGSTSVQSLELMTITSQQQHTAQAAARSQVLGMDYTRGSLSFPMANKGHNAVADFNDWLAQENLGYFRAPPKARWQQHWAELQSATTERCEGQLNQVHQLSDKQLRLDGQLIHASETIEHLVIGDGSKVLGFGHNHQPAAGWLPWRNTGTRDWYFVSFATLDSAAPPERFYALGVNRRGQTICYAELTPLQQ